MHDKKWSFYKSVCIIDMICISIFILLVFYGIFIEDKTVSSDDIIGIILVFAISSICYVSSFLGIRLTGKFLLHENINRSFRNQLIVFYILLCLFFFFVLLMDYFAISNLIKEQSLRNSTFRYDLEIAALDFILLSLSLTSLYKIIFTWKLVKAVKKNHTDFSTSIETIGIIR
jgi:hypothetical protein